MKVQEAICEVIERRNLTEDQAAAVAREILGGGATAAQTAALLVGIRGKGETVDEITGFALAVREAMTAVPARSADIVDTCGTGGDGAETFNVSTVSAFVAAGAGCHVAKHGNGAISSRCGSVDVLRVLGVNTELAPEHAARLIDEIGIAFMFTPKYHHGDRYVAAPRHEMGIRTVFNLLGPLSNPAGATRQVLGVYDRALTEIMARVMQRLGSLHCLVVHGKDGLDEITLTDTTFVTELKDGAVRSFAIRPEELGVLRADLGTLRGGSAETNAQIARAVLDGEPGAARDIVLLNAGAAIYVGGKATSIGEGVHKAAESIDTGRAKAKLQQLVARSREEGPVWTSCKTYWHTNSRSLQSVSGCVRSMN